ncbi:unnamed protein product [Paramecium octaurelia]|uniref:Uncharacterized protein n=1 Tax=Paramecium octaurelia TaxID=43137 RepID=A0A8S1YL88_PAROT|nr:unnamed protein product [Paramecium octaurelia]
MQMECKMKIQQHFSCFIRFLMLKQKITSYKYNFPSVSQDFENNPYMIRRELIIQNAITSWQYIYANLRDRALDFSIIFYEAQNTQSYGTSIDVKQFHNYQLKFTYGNIQQNNKIIQMQMFEIYYLSIVYKCHQSCQECDGPPKYHCLTCSEEQKRIYIPEFKQCACKYGTIDYNNGYIDYMDQDIQLNLQFNVKQPKNLHCKVGQFEFNCDCMKCPQGVYKDSLICVECCQNVGQRSQSPNCREILELTQISGQYLIPEIDNFYFYDSSDLIYTNILISDSLGISTIKLILQFFLILIFRLKIIIQDEFHLYQHFRYSSQIFLSFCNQRESSMFDQHLCYNCQIKHCLSCGLTINDNCFVQYVMIKVHLEIFTYASCLPPYYPSFSRECKLCTLENCLYCFEFKRHPSQIDISIELEDLTESYAETQIGCMQCEIDYYFNFKLGICLKILHQSRIVQYLLLNQQMRTYVQHLPQIIFRCQERLIVEIFQQPIFKSVFLITIRNQPAQHVNLVIYYLVESAMKVKNKVPPIQLNSEV